MYERLHKEAEHHGINIYEKTLSPRIKGLYADNVVWINRNIPTTAEKACVLAEELGHHHTTAGDITDQSNVDNRKQEKRARAWAYEKLVPLEKIVQAHQDRVANRYELAEYLCVTEEFLQAAIARYREKYGLCKAVGHYVVYFEPLGVIKMFE